MDDLVLRYERLVAAWAVHHADAVRLEALMDGAQRLAADAEPTWYRVQATALAAAAGSVVGRRVDLASVVDAGVPPIDEAAPERVEDLVAGSGSLAERLAAQREATTVHIDVLPRVMSPLLALLRHRAQDDLELSVDLPTLKIGIGRDGPRSRWYRIDRARLGDRLVLNGDRSWTAGRAVRVASAASMRHLARALRPPRPQWQPSPQGTVDRGLEAVGREVLVGDHELAHELGRIARAVGSRWSGERIVAVERAIDELAPAVAAVAVADDHDVRALERLGVDLRRADELAARWRDPLARAACLGAAAGPPLVRAWLARTGQTIGLGRLVREWLVPTELREGGR